MKTPKNNSQDGVSLHTKKLEDNGKTPSPDTQTPEDKGIFDTTDDYNDLDAMDTYEDEIRIQVGMSKVSQRIKAEVEKVLDDVLEIQTSNFRFIEPRKVSSYWVDSTIQELKKRLGI